MRQAQDLDVVPKWLLALVPELGEVAVLVTNGRSNPAAGVVGALATVPADWVRCKRASRSSKSALFRDLVIDRTVFSVCFC